MKISDENADLPKNFWHSLSWHHVRNSLLCATLASVTWKIFNADIQVSLGDLSATDIVALLLALFSIGLSAAFYFKASEASTLFYDNTYKFTKEMSEILGRIEAGFGERLRHLDEGYSGIRDNFDKLHLIGNAEAKSQDAIHELERKAERIINEFAEKANIAGGEKDSLLTRLKQVAAERDKAQADLRKFRNLEAAPVEGDHLIDEIVRRISRLGRLPRTSRELNESLHKITPTLPPDFFKMSSRLGLTDVDKELTDLGKLMVQRELHKRTYRQHETEANHM